MKNIHVLPTDKPSRVYSYNGVLGLAKSFQHGSEVILNQNIYITNDEEIKEGWSYDRMMKSVSKVNNVYSEKIILTTDPDLIKDGVQEIPDEFLEWFVKNPSCEYVETVNVPYFDESGYSYLLIIPKEEQDYTALFKQVGTKQETLEEVARLKHRELSTAEIGIIPNFVDGFVEGYKLAQQQNKNLYSDEDMTKYALYILNNTVITPKEWFNKNKKK